MLELIIEMIGLLVVALVLGFLFGWLLSKKIVENRHIKEINNITNKLLKNGNAIKKLKDININRENKIELLVDENRKIKLEIDKSEERLNNSLINKNIELKRLLDESKEESHGLERVLMKAEKIIENQNSEISLLKKESKKESSEEKHGELIITKEQLFYIEIQLLKYQKEISNLNKINRKLEESKSKSKIKLDLERELEDSSKLDDSTIAKLFGETYKKIIKS